MEQQSQYLEDDKPGDRTVPWF